MIRRRTPEKYLLWFHHLSWDYRLRSGRTLWDELVMHYSHGVDAVRDMRATWATLAPYVDAERYAETSAFLAIQEQEARWWRDASLAYFQSLSKRPLPRASRLPSARSRNTNRFPRPYAPAIPAGPPRRFAIESSKRHRP